MAAAWQWLTGRLLIVLLAEPSNAFHAAASWTPHRLVPATLGRAKPTMGFTNWLDARSEKFWESSDTSVSATGGGDAGVAGLTKVANSVDKAGRMLAAVALIASLHLTSAYAWLYALKLTALVAIVGPLVLPPVLQYLGDIVVSFRRALTPGLSRRAIVRLTLTLTLTLTLMQGQGERAFQRQLCYRSSRMSCEIKRRVCSVNS